MDLIPDAHCHLDEIDDPAGAVRAARAAGVGPILALGMDRISSTKTRALRDELGDLILLGVGIHPSCVPLWDEDRLEAEFAFVRERLPEADCLGEVGLDYKDAADAFQRDRQHAILDRQLALASEHRKPVSFHCRRAERPTVARAVEFRRATGLGINLHWFTHSGKLARKCGEAGVYISVGPSILWREDQAQVAAIIDPDHLLVETDCPVPFNDESARPAWAARVARRLAEVRGESLQALAARVARNFRRYLGAEEARA